MKKFQFVLIPVIAAVILTGCFSMVKDSSNSDTAFYPSTTSGLGDIYSVKTVENPFKLPVMYKNIQNIAITVSKVDEQSFFDNAIGGYAACEGYLDASKFKEMDQILAGDVEIFADPNNTKLDEDGGSHGYVNLPITDFGYYYLTFEYPGQDDISYDSSDTSGIVKYHLLLEVNSTPREFNY